MGKAKADAGNPMTKTSMDLVNTFRKITSVARESLLIVIQCDTCSIGGSSFWRLEKAGCLQDQQPRPLLTLIQSIRSCFYFVSPQIRSVEAVAPSLVRSFT
eukprot:s218_g18.t1